MDYLLIAFLTLLNGAFAMSELALASSRKARLAAMAEAGDRGAQDALRLLENPTQFLSTVQVGITSIGMLNGIIGEAAFTGAAGQLRYEKVDLPGTADDYTKVLGDLNGDRIADFEIVLVGNTGTLHSTDFIL